MFQVQISASLVAFSLFLGSSAVAGDLNRCIQTELIRLLDRQVAANPAPLQRQLTLGVEVEGEIPKDLSRRQLALQVRDGLLEKGFEARLYLKSPEQDKWQVLYESEGFQYAWEIKGDASIRTTQQGVEIVSPILRTPRDKEIFRQIIGDLRESGFRSTPSSGGVHVHVGVDQWRSEDLAILLEASADLQRQLRKTFATSERRKPHTAYLSKEEREKTLINLLGGSDFKSAIRYTALDRKRVLNLKAMNAHGTVEFRLFNSTVKPQELELMMNFSEKLVDGIVNAQPELIAYLQRTRIQNMDLKEVGKLIGVPLDLSSDLLQEIKRESLRSYAQSLQFRADDFQNTYLMNQGNFIQTVFDEISAKEMLFLLGIGTGMSGAIYYALRDAEEAIESASLNPDSNKPR
jgi:hypothetical protein